MARFTTAEVGRVGYWVGLISAALQKLDGARQTKDKKMGL